MLKTSSVPLLTVAVLLCLTSVGHADRPGFYSGNTLQGGSRHEPAGHPGGSGPGYGRPWWPRHPGGAGVVWGAGPGVFWGVGPGLFGPPVFGYPYFPYGSGTGIYFDPGTNTAQYFLPPIYAPPELNYGPQAMDRFLGVHRNPMVVPPLPDLVPEGNDRAVTPGEVADRLRKSNDEARARARRFIEFGDALFAKQQFHAALQRYKSALEAAPDLVDAYVREGFALIAVDQYRLAAKALKIAIELDAEYVKSRFKLDDLYGDNHLAATSHLEVLANEALASPANGDLLFLVGMMLHADGEPRRALRFFAKAAELGGPEAARLLAPLLGEQPPAEAVPAAPDGAAELNT